MLFDLGAIALNPRGRYLPEETYHPLDLVTLDETSYICKVTVSGVPPNHPTQGTYYWQENAGRGIQGVQGPVGAGAQGAQGAIGTQGPVGPGGTGSIGPQGATGPKGIRGNAWWSSGRTLADGASVSITDVKGSFGKLGLGDMVMDDKGQVFTIVETDGLTGRISLNNRIVGGIGATGSQGSTGSRGTQGYDGPQGADGMQGAQGTVTTWTGTLAEYEALQEIDPTVFYIITDQTAGTQGVQGPMGATGPISDTTPFWKILNYKLIGDGSEEQSLVIDGLNGGDFYVTEGTVAGFVLQNTVVDKGGTVSDDGTMTMPAYLRLTAAVDITLSPEYLEEVFTFATNGGKLEAGKTYILKFWQHIVFIEELVSL